MARLVVSTNQRIMQSTALTYTALPYSSRAMPSTALPYSAMPPVMSARPCPMGYYNQGNQFPLMPNPNWMSEREQMLQHKLLQEWQQFEAWRASQAQPGLPIKVEDDVEIISVRSASAKRPDLKTRLCIKPLNVPGLLQHLTDPPLPRGTSQASPKRVEHRPAAAQDLEAFKADMTSMLSDMLQSSLSKFASQFKPSSGGQGESVSTQNVASVEGSGGFEGFEGSFSSPWRF